MRKVAIALFILVCTSQALADWTQIRSTDFFLNPPPVAGSRAYREDFRVLHELQDTRDPRDCRLAQLQRIPTFDVFYGATAGLFSKAELDSARPVLSRVFKFSERAADYQKGKFGRPRPYSVDPTLHPCAHMPEGARAYPSSHAVLAVVGSCVLARAFPERARAIETYGGHLADLRFIVGVHHPTDVVAGKDLAAQICQRVFAEPDFRREFEQITSR